MPLRRRGVGDRCRLEQRVDLDVLGQGSGGSGTGGATTSVTGTGGAIGAGTSSGNTTGGFFGQLDGGACRCGVVGDPSEGSGGRLVLAALGLVFAASRRRREEAGR